MGRRCITVDVEDHLVARDLDLHRDTTLPFEHSLDQASYPLVARHVSGSLATAS